MRPVRRGGKPATFTHYDQARQPLGDRLGEYCSYCERWRSDAIHVEHKLPKGKHAEDEHNWENLLLACSNCNSSKPKRRLRLASYYWPDSDNTFRAFVYGPEGTVAPNPGLSETERARAGRTIELLKLDRHPLGPNKPRDGDVRWRHRAQAWNLAEHLLRLYTAGRVDVSALTAVMRERGLWSVWMAVFGAYIEVRRALIDALPGTAKDCFDPVTCEPIPRPGGDL